MQPIFTAALRGFLLLCGAIVLGLSVSLAKQQVNGHVPSQTGFGSFAGAFGIIASAIGLVALFLDSFPQLISLVADGAAAVFYLAGGIALAVALQGVSCTDDSDVANYNRYVNGILDGGCVSANGDLICGVVGSGSGYESELKARCVRAEADFAFEFIGCAFGIGALALGFLAFRKSGGATFV